MQLPLNALRAFEVSARLLSFTRAAGELNVTQASVSQHVKNLEGRLGVQLFRRLPRGLALTDEGRALAPVLAESFSRIQRTLEQFDEGGFRETLSVAAVGTFVVGWLLPRLTEFQQAHPFIDLRLFTNNNRVELAEEGLDYAIRFGDGAWHGTEVDLLLETSLTPMCSPSMAHALKSPSDLVRSTLLRSYRTEEWSAWFAVAGAACPLIRGPVFDSSLTMAEAAAQGAGVALLPFRMFESDLRQGRLVRPFSAELKTASYWLTRLKQRPPTKAMLAFREWILAADFGRLANAVDM